MHPHPRTHPCLHQTCKDGVPGHFRVSFFELRVSADPARHSPLPLSVMLCGGPLPCPERVLRGRTHGSTANFSWKGIQTMSTTASLRAVKRAFNFNAGPAALPLPVLERIREELLDYRGTGMSVM